MPADSKPPEPTLTPPDKNGSQALIVGGGISGLVAAFELSESREVAVTVIEAEAECGGKMRGRFNPTSNRFEEHSIRSLSSTYFSLFNVFQRAGLLKYLTPVDEYLFYSKASGKNVPVNRKEAMSAGTVRELIKTFDLSKKDMLHLAEQILHHVNASDEVRASLANKKAGEVIGIEGFDDSTREFIINWFGILTGARMHSKAVDIMDSFLLMFMPMTQSPDLPPGETSKSYCFNRPTSEVIDALVGILRERGVTFVTDCRLTSLSQTDRGVMVTTEDGRLNDQLFDSSILAVPHEVMWKLGLINASKPFNDEWSFGSQFPMKEVPEALKPFAGMSYNLCFDAPWNIVFQVQHQGSFWRDVTFPEDYPYNLSATCSSPHNNGSLYGKPFTNCSPEEALHEILFQLGLTDEAERAPLIGKAVVDPVYLEFTHDWQMESESVTVELGPILAEERRWVNRSQIYVRSAEDPEVEPETNLNGVFLAGEVITVPGKWKIPTMEQAAVSGRQAAQLVFNHLGIRREIKLDFSQPEHQTSARAAELLLKVINHIT